MVKMKVNRTLKTTFNKVSALYDKSRVSYPQDLIDDIINFAKIKHDANILDIGCGSGQATISFAEKGFNTTGLDISPNLIKVASKKYSNHLNLQFKVGSFEDTILPENSFDIVTCGLAWHWINTKNRYEKVHRILKRNGIIALFWSWQEYKESAFLMELGTIFDKFITFSSENKENNNTKKNKINLPRMKDYAPYCYEELKQNELFTHIQKKEYKEILAFSKEQYKDLVMTYSWIQKLTRKEKGSLEKEINQLYEKYPEPLIIPYKFFLVLGKKK